MHILRRSAKRYQLILVCLSGHPFVILVHTTVTWPPLDHLIAALTSMAYGPRPVVPQELFDSILDELGSPFKSENSKSTHASLQSSALVCTPFRLRAHRLLFRHVRFVPRHYLASDSKRISHIQELYHLLEADTYLTSCIRSLDINIDADGTQQGLSSLPGVLDILYISTSQAQGVIELILSGAVPRHGTVSVHQHNNHYFG